MTREETKRLRPRLGARERSPRSLPRNVAFWALTLILGALLSASSAPSPLYVVYQAEWHFSAVTLTSVFAVYALALLGALLVFGAVSDHIGRRPTLLAALAVQTVAMLAFAEASGVGWLFAGRILQGVATGTAMGAISAALLDLHPPSKALARRAHGRGRADRRDRARGPALRCVVEYGPDPDRLVFWLLAATFVLAVPVARSIPETVVRDGAWKPALRPRVAVPRHLRPAFASALPALAAT